MTTRRHVLQVLAAAPALTSCGGEHLPDPAAAWRNPGAGEHDPRRFALAHAILAPNPHNTQPWQVTLDGEDGMTLFCDLERRLPFTDPPNRQIAIGCGAFLALYRMALISSGHGCEIAHFPEGAPAPGALLDARPLAHVRMVPLHEDDHGPDPLFAQITRRRTNRNVCDARVPPADALSAIANAATDWTSDPAQRDALTVHAEADPARVVHLRDLVWRAFDREMHTPGALEETYSWLRFGHDEVARHRDGLAIKGPLIGLAKMAGMFSRANMINPESEANKQALQDWRRKAETAPAFMWLSTPDDAPQTRLLAGMAYARMNLAAAAQGIAMHAWSQALQEYSEMADIYREMRTFLGAGGRTVQMLVRVGYADPVEPAARRGVEALFARPPRAP